MTNETGTLQLVFNGEIYNYEKLTADLKAKGASISKPRPTPGNHCFILV